MQKCKARLISLQLAQIAMLLMPVSTIAAADFDCLIEPNKVVDVSSAVEGVVERFHVERSDFVEQDQLVVELESGVEIAAVNKARARSQMQGELNSQRSSLKFTERRFDRIKHLFKKGLVSSHEMDEAETQVQLARAELQKAEDEQRLAALELQRAEETLNLRRIRSPFKGVVVERYKSVGESVEDKPIIKLAQIDPLRVEVFMPATEFGQVKPGMYAKVKPENSETEEYLTEAKVVDRVIDAASGTFTVRLELPNPDYTIASGLRCKLSFLSESESAEIRAQQIRVSEPEEKTLQDFENKLNDAGQNALGEPPTEMLAAAYETSVSVEPQQTYVEPVSQCWSVGPITDETLMTRISDELQPVVSRLTSRESTEITQTRFLILSPPQASLSEAKALAKQIQAMGIKDVAVLYKGPLKNRVSFGLYRKEVLASERLAQLENKQIEAQIHPRHTTVNKYWLDLEQYDTGVDEGTLIQILEEQQPGLQLTQSSCQEERTAKIDF
ncbi:MAG: efflux RND transporter periplasmic adaptor subunit [Gammaproteobacteria bacterium]|nr:efflux RND transporter periplasmic adaptor subunit [Gammaproteobacteria bacterium]